MECAIICAYMCNVCVFIRVFWGGGGAKHVRVIECVRMFLKPPSEAGQVMLLLLLLFIIEFMYKRCAHIVLNVFVHMCPGDRCFACVHVCVHSSQWNHQRAERVGDRQCKLHNYPSDIFAPTKQRAQRPADHQRTYALQDTTYALANISKCHVARTLFSGWPISPHASACLV